MKSGVGARTSNEAGQVSIVTVIVFILLFSVLVISFSRIMVTASRQAVNDELAASAKAAAESGIEDAKRILSYCAAGGSGCEMLNKRINDPSVTCTTISANTSLMSSLQREVLSGSSIRVGDGSNQEEYLCLKMTMVTPDYLGSLTANGNADGKSESVVIPLKFINESGASTAPKSIRIQWHNTSPDQDGNATLLAGSDLPSSSKWNKTIPAVLRAEFVAIPKSGFRIEDLTNNTRAVTLRPSSSATDTTNVTVVSSGLYSLDSWIKRNDPNVVSPKVSILRTKCQSGNSSDNYACNVSFTIPRVPGSGSTTNYIFDTTTYNYYLRMQAVYQNTHFRVSAKDEAGRDMLFDHVQADIDVTGRAMDSLKRLSARLGPSSGSDDYLWWPDYAVDTASKVCKDMVISAWYGTEKCTD
jgi:Tfp pilus assembly protein PilX